MEGRGTSICEARQTQEAPLGLLSMDLTQVFSPWEDSTQSREVLWLELRPRGAAEHKGPMYCAKLRNRRVSQSREELVCVFKTLLSSRGRGFQEGSGEEL